MIEVAVVQPALPIGADETSSELEAACFKAVAKKPKERFQSADEFAAALQDALRG